MVSSNGLVKSMCTHVPKSCSSWHFTCVQNNMHSNASVHTLWKRVKEETKDASK